MEERWPWPIKEPRKRELPHLGPPQQFLIPSYHGVHKMKALGGGGVILGNDLDFDPLAIIGGMHCREGLLPAQGPCRPLGHTK